MTVYRGETRIAKAGVLVVTGDVPAADVVDLDDLLVWGGHQSGQNYGR